MNLTSLFNFKYLKENIKKSKGIIILFSCVIPLISVLFILLFSNNVNEANIITAEELAWVNMVGLYIIPIAISFSLFGYVYKKSSVDFVNSMPINRKSIFVTNTIGGILLILFIQAITLILLLLCSVCCENLVIFPMMVVDIFVSMTIGYIFVFMASNVAMALSGTYFAQIALTLLIIFLVPFCMDGFNDFGYNSNVSVITSNEEKLDISFIETENTYTLPYGIFHSIIKSIDIQNLLINKGLIKSVILSILYFVIGLILFEKRKMENTEESFASVKVHEFVKALTMLPMFSLLNFLNPGMDTYIFVLSLVIIYFFLYDFIVKRKVKFLVSVLTLIITVCALQGICFISKVIKNKVCKEEYYKEDVKAVAFKDYYDVYNVNYPSMPISENAIEKNSKYYFNNREIIDFLFDSSLVDNCEYDNCLRFAFNMILKDGKECCSLIYLNFDDGIKLLNMIKEDEEFKNFVSEDIDKNAVIMIENIIANEEISEKIVNEYNNISAEQILDLKYNDYCYITAKYYENHSIISKEIPVNLSKNVLEISSNLLNSVAKEKLKKAILNNDKTIEFFVKTDNTSYTFYYLRDEVEEFYINDILNSEFDLNKPYYIINGKLNSYDESIYYFTNNIEKIEEFIAKEKYNEDSYIEKIY